MANKDDTRTRILKAAGPIFAGKGYDAATVREICQAADAGLASVNYHFRDKESLYAEVVEHAHRTLDEARPPLPDWPPGTPPETKLRDFIRRLMTQIQTGPKAIWAERLLRREFRDPTPACAVVLKERFRRDFGPLEHILDEVLPAETPPHKRRQMLWSVIGQCVAYLIARGFMRLTIDDEEWESHYGAEQLAEHISEVCLAALGFRPPLSK